jgi:phage replication O-like protein O
MASPQLENGYTRTANELFEAIMISDFSKRQRNVLDLIIRLSYGCGKRHAIIRPSDYEIVGVGRNHIKDTLKELIEANVLVVNEDITYINKDYPQWKISKINKADRLSEVIRRNLNDIPETGTGVPKTGTKVPKTGIGEDKEVPETGIDSSQNGNSTVPETGIGTPEKSTIGKRFRLPKETLKKLKEIYKRSSSSPPKGRGRDSPKYKFSTKQMELAEYLLQCIRNNLPDYKGPNLDAWANEMRLINENDKRDESRIRRLITWCQQDSFWKSNILSPGKLREKFDQLELRMNGQNQNIRGAPHNATGTSRRNIDNDPIPVSKLIIRDTTEQVTDLPDLP